MANKTTIKLELDTTKLMKMVKYNGWDVARDYYRAFIDDCLLVVKANTENNIVLDDKLQLNDNDRIKP